MSETVIAKLSAWLGFKVDDKGLQKFKLGLVGATAAIIKFTNDTVKAVNQLDNFNKRTGISENFAYEFMNMAKVANISSDTILNNLETISRARQDILRGEGNIQPWALLGVDITDNPEKVFNDIIEKIKTINDPALRSKLLTDAGLDAQLTNLSNIDMSGVATDLYLDNKNRDALKELSSEINKLGLNLRLLKDKFIAFATPIRWTVELINRLIFGFTNLIESTIGLNKFSKIFTGAIIALFIAWKPLWAIIGAVILVIDDFLTYLRGGESVIGKFIGKLKELIGENGFKALVEVLKVVGLAIAGTFAINKIVAFSSATKAAIAGIGTAWKGIDAIFKKSPLGIAIMGGYLAYKGGEFIGEKIGGDKILNAWDKAKSFLGLGKTQEEMQNDYLKSVEAGRQVPIIPTNLATSNINNRNSNINIVNNMNITGNNAREIGETIKEKQQDLIIDNTAMQYGY